MRAHRRPDPGEPERGMRRDRDQGGVPHAPRARRRTQTALRRQARTFNKPISAYVDKPQHKGYHQPPIIIMCQDSRRSAFSKNVLARAKELHDQIGFLGAHQGVRLLERRSSRSAKDTLQIGTSSSRRVQAWRKRCRVATHPHAHPATGLGHPRRYLTVLLWPASDPIHIVIQRPEQYHESR
ncbi:hypothetical protein BD626DRAFT_537146 [Schizophyllum amplum]|uniref:Uncharacterized protein n=1 Tax=Schizophyllum amplum TaxID=97359 RepID=A0A550CEK9_9AGAR|nr:hypothetical protein BD626DRAFT_537146 [Auriculariopsis ampla]